MTQLYTIVKRYECQACGQVEDIETTRSGVHTDEVPKGWVHTLAWLLCPGCIAALRDFLRERQQRLKGKSASR